MIEPKVFSVGQINRYIKNLLENDFILNSLLAVSYTHLDVYKRQA